MNGIYCLPEEHSYLYIAHVPWPKSAMEQSDWVQAVDTLEQWLNEYVGVHNEEWAYAVQTDDCQASVAFRQAKCKTLFLITWS